MSLFKQEKAKNAFFIGLLCSISYLAVYFARNILSAVSPAMTEGGGFDNEYIGSLSSLYFITYATGQLINGIIGDRIPAKFMISFGLILGGVSNFMFSAVSVTSPNVALYVYGMTGFFLSMIYAPMTKVIAENTDPLYAPRCSLGYTFSEFFGSPLAGVAAAFLAWQSTFRLSSAFLGIMGITIFLVFSLLEKKGVIKPFVAPEAEKSEKKGKIHILFKHRIVKFTLISVVTGVVRTTVVFWLPTYLSQNLGFSAEHSALIFTASTFVMSFTTFIAVFVYERLGRSMDRALLCFFISAALFFGILYAVKNPVINIICLVLAIMSSGCAASMIWVRYCPGLRDTGMVSGVTGFLDFVSYMSASISSTVFADAVGSIGWNGLILIWFGLMVVGVVVCLPYKRKKQKA